jgi:hypothetical protein
MKELGVIPIESNTKSIESNIEIEANKKITKMHLK